MAQLWESARGAPTTPFVFKDGGKTPLKNKRKVVSPNSTEKRRSSSRQRKATFDSAQYVP